jgi:hypothetical protein
MNGDKDENSFYQSMYKNMKRYELDKYYYNNRNRKNIKNKKKK